MTKPTEDTFGDNLVQVELDFTPETPLGELLDHIDAHDGVIVDFFAKHVAGGNPTLTLGFVDRPTAEKFVRAVYELDKYESVSHYFFK